MKCLRSLTLLVPLLLGCRPPATVQVAPGVSFRFCPPEAAPDFFVNQEVVFTLPGGRRETVLAAIENQGGALRVVASTPLGQTLFTVRVQAGMALVDARVPLPGRLDARALPALVQFALWPEAAVRAALAAGTRMEQEGDRRTLLRKGQVVWSATRTGDGLVLEAPGMGVTLRIRTLEDL
jgi:hypothetical protein